MGPPPDSHSADVAHRAEDELVHEVSSLRRLFRERRLSIRTMEPPLRIATGGALASLVAVILLILVRDLKAPTVVIGRSAGLIHEVSLPIFIATLALVSVGFAYVLTAAVLASWQVELVSLLVITGVIGWQSGAFGTLPGSSGFIGILPPWGGWVARGLLVAVWLVPVMIRIGERGDSRRPATRQLRLTILGAYVLIFGAFFGVLATGSPSVGGLNLFPQLVSLMMNDLVLLVTPILQVASVDFGEWGGLIGERTAVGIAGKRLWHRTTLAAALSLSLVILGYQNLSTTVPELSARRVWSAGRSTLLLLAALAVLVGIARLIGLHRRAWPTTLNFAAVFAVCALGTYLIVPVEAAVAGYLKPTPTVQVTPTGEFTGAADVIATGGGTAGGEFTLLIPRGWLSTKANGLARWSGYLVPGPTPGSFVPGIETVLVGTVPVQADAAALARLNGLALTGPQTQSGQWTRAAAAIPGGSLLLWASPVPGSSRQVTYEVFEIVKGAPLSAAEPLFEAIASSFRPSGQAPAPLSSGSVSAPGDLAAAQVDRLQALDMEITGALALLGLIAVARFGRRWPRRLIGTLLLFCMTTLATLLFFANSVGRGLLGTRTHWPYVGQYGLLCGVGVLALIALACTLRSNSAYRRRLTTGLIALEATLLVLQGMSVAYDHALQASRISIWAAIIVLLAVAWDVTMSGDSLTNHSSPHVPRATRVLAFFGYVLLVAAAVLFYSAQRIVATGQSADALFEPESITQAALFRIAFPLAVLLFLLRFARDSDQPAGSRAPTPPGRHLEVSGAHKRQPASSA